MYLYLNVIFSFDLNVSYNFPVVFVTLSAFTKVYISCGRTCRLLKFW